MGAAALQRLLRCFADALSNLGIPSIRGFNQAPLVVAGEQTRVLAGHGWPKAGIQRFIVEHARRRVADFKRAARLPGEPTPEDETTWRYLFEKPEDVLVVSAGGQAGRWSACRPGWGNKWTKAVTMPIEPLA